MKRKVKTFSDQRGLTLIEMLVSISVVILLAAASSMFIIRSFDVNRYTIEQGLNAAVLQNTLRNFSANLRESRQGEEGSYLLDDCQDYEMTFYADTDNDGTSEKLRYYIDSQQLILATTDPDVSGDPASYATGTTTTSVIGNGVVNSTLTEPLFYFYAEDETLPLASGFSPSQVQLVRIRVYANVDVDNVPDSMMIETMVRPRNIP